MGRFDSPHEVPGASPHRGHVTGTSDATNAIMMRKLLSVMLIGAAGCATTATTETTWPAVESSTELGHTGQVESVHEVVQRVQGNPAAGALVGGVVGALLFRGRPLGVVSGAAVGAATSQGSAEYRSYDVAVRFDDGGYRVFQLRAPFAPGSRVVLTRRGLHPA